MRTIEFRGLCIKDQIDGICVGTWVFGDLEYNKLKDKARIHAYRDNGDYYRFYDIDPDTICQFTGLYDKNNVKIYEGDIVECVSWNEYFSDGSGKPMEPFRRKMYVDFRKGGFKMVEPMPEPMKDNEWDIIFDGDIVILGNIYDNKELLTQK